MERPPTIMNAVFARSRLREPRFRRVAFAVVAAVLAVLCVFPRRYDATVKLAPQETNAAGLSTILGQLGGNYAALLGNNQPYDINYQIANSFDLEQDVLRRMGLMGKPGFETTRAAVRRLRRLVAVRSLRGGVFEFEVVANDPDFALKLDATYARAFQNRIAQLGREQTAYKNRVLTTRMQDAAGRLSQAQAALEAYRQRNRLAAPDVQLGAAVSQLASLQGSLQAKRVELQSALQFAAPGNIDVKNIQAQIGSLQQQIAEVQGRTQANGGLTALGIAQRSNEFINLQRDVQFAQSLYEAYSRYLEGSAVEDLSADFNVQVIEPPYVDPSYYINRVPAALLGVLLTLGIAAEVYLAAPRPGRRVATDGRGS